MRTTQRPFTFLIGSLFWGMRASKAHSADGMRLSFSEVFGAKRSTAVSTNTDGRPNVTSQLAYKAVHQIPHFLVLKFLALVFGPAWLPPLRISLLLTHDSNNYRARATALSWTDDHERSLAGKRGLRRPSPDKEPPCHPRETDLLPRARSP